MAKSKTYTESDFTAAVASWRAVDGDLTHARAMAQSRYHDVAYAPAKIRHAIDVLARKDTRAQDRVYGIVAAVSPRDWTRGIPVHYVRTRLTWRDATTRAELAEVPAPAYGYTLADSTRFAQALPSWIMVRAYSRTGAARDAGHVATDGAELVRLIMAHHAEDWIRIHVVPMACPCGCGSNQVHQEY